MAKDDLIRFGEPTIHQDGMTFGFEWKRDGTPLCRIQAADVRQEGDDIYANFTIWWLLDQPLGARPIIPEGKVKVNSLHSTGWRTVASQASKRIDGVDWDGAMTLAVDYVTNVLKTGSPTVELFNQERSTEPPFLLEPWISRSGITTLYGEGGLSKSLLTLAMAISVSTGIPIFGKEPIITGPVIIFDYEDDHQTHVDRLLAICRSFGIPQGEAKVYHHALSAKVASAHREMQRRIRETGAVLGILDSVGMGRGGSAIAAEDTIRLYRYLRSLSIPFLCIDHISKEAKDKQGAADRDAYGSVYSMNSVRLGWSIARQTTASNDDRIHMFAANTKHNHVRKQPSQTISVQYRNDEVGVPEFIDIEVGNDFGMMMPTVGTMERVQMLLSDGEPRTYRAMSDSLGVPESTLRKIVSEDQGMNRPRFSTYKDGRTVWVRSVGHTSPTLSPHMESEDEIQ